MDYTYCFDSQVLICKIHDYVKVVTQFIHEFNIKERF